MVICINTTVVYFFLRYYGIKEPKKLEIPRHHHQSHCNNSRFVHVHRRLGSWSQRGMSAAFSYSLYYPAALFQKSLHRPSGLNASMLSNVRHAPLFHSKPFLHYAADVDNSINIGTGRDKNIWNDFLKDMNDALNDLDLEFKTMQDESTGRKMCALVRNISRLFPQY